MLHGIIISTNMSYIIMSNNIRKRHNNLFLIYYPLILIIVGTILNLFTFLIFCRRRFRDKNRRGTLHFLRATVLFDILMLYGWNFDNYLRHVHKFTLLLYSISSCRFIAFLNYFTSQVSAWLRVFICLDRYLSLSRLHKTCFSSPKNVLIIISCIILVFTIINGHLLIFPCFYKSNGIIDPNPRFYNIYPTWDYVNLCLYNCLPFLFMIIFNSGVIYHLTHLRQTTILQTSRIQHRSISITILTTTFLFLIMTIPASMGFAFFTQNTSPFILQILDNIMYTYHILSFPLYTITFIEFRREVLRVFQINKRNLILPRIR